MAHIHDNNMIRDDDSFFIINPDTRDITNESGNTLKLIQFDHNSERCTFQIPRYIDGHDMMSGNKVEVHYVNTGTEPGSSVRLSKSGKYTINDIQANPDDEETIICSWLISSDSTQLAGSLSFLIKFVCYDETNPTRIVYIWHTNVCNLIEIYPGMNNSDEVVLPYSVDSASADTTLSLPNDSVSHIHDISMIKDDDSFFIIDPDTRNITNGSGGTLKLMQFDHNSERCTFELPRLIDNHNMMECDRVEVHYVNTSTGTSASARQSNHGIYTINNFQAHPDDEEKIVCTWLISANSTQLSGTLKFLIKFICYDDADQNELSYVWHTNTCNLIEIHSGMNNTDEVITMYPDAFEQLNRDMDDLEEYVDLELERVDGELDDLKESTKTDTTLSQNGKPADAKVVGDRLTELADKNSSIYRGPEAPTDPDVDVWIDTDEEGGEEGGSTIEVEAISLDEIDIICSASSGMLEAGLYNVYNSEWIYSWYELFRNNILNTDIFIQTSRLTAVFANKALIAGDLIIPNIEQGFKIDSDAFSGCTALRGITIPATVTSIGADSFANCTSLESVIFKGTTAQWNTIVDPRLGKDYWAANTPITTVYCSNGTVVL